MRTFIQSCVEIVVFHSGVGLQPGKCQGRRASQHPEPRAVPLSAAAQGPARNGQVQCPARNTGISERTSSQRSPLNQATQSVRVLGLPQVVQVSFFQELICGEFHQLRFIARHGVDTNLLALRLDIQILHKRDVFRTIKNGAPVVSNSNLFLQLISWENNLFSH